MASTVSIAVYPGSFDPFTRGHLDVALRAARLFDRVIVAVAKDAEKKHLFTIEQRVAMAADACCAAANIAVDSFTGLVVDYVVAQGAQAMVKGVRTATDLEREAVMCEMNRSLAPEVETVLLVARPQFAFVSSSLLKHVHGLGGDVSGLVTPMVLHMLDARVRGE